ncbi:MbtH family protein [Burkholderia metallica]|uniref:MbtH family protein n=1 Tax=Burkholderia metallica TaxID=488729 RepID=UPI0008415A5F|nr:MbtH family NRPS accessory protein [Burkholderia metallica]AOJ36099.1 antibiotic synthesis protein MbtH [Burkholderia metallica]
MEINNPESIYEVVVNDEAQYSIWMADKPLPQGWQKIGMQGTKNQCLTHIREIWTDMRPRSLREQMDAGN